MQFIILILLLIIIAFIIFVVLKQHISKELSNPKHLESLMSALDDLVYDRVNLIEGKITELENSINKAKHLINLLDKESMLEQKQEDINKNNIYKPTRSIKALDTKATYKPHTQADNLKDELINSVPDEDLVHVDLSSRRKTINYEGDNDSKHEITEAKPILLNIVEDLQEEKVKIKHSISMASDVNKEVVGLYREGKDIDEISSILGIPQARTSLIVEMFISGKKNS